MEKTCRDQAIHARQDSELSALVLTPLIKVGWPWMAIVWLEIGNDFMVDQAKSVHEIIYYM